MELDPKIKAELSEILKKKHFSGIRRRDVKEERLDWLDKLLDLAWEMGPPQDDGPLLVSLFLDILAEVSMVQAMALAFDLGRAYSLHRGEYY